MRKDTTTVEIFSRHRITIDALAENEFLVSTEPKFLPSGVSGKTYYVEGLVGLFECIAGEFGEPPLMCERIRKAIQLATRERTIDG